MTVLELVGMMALELAGMTALELAGMAAPSELEFALSGLDPRLRGDDGA